jgi:diguanylate cyclase (GGDEF)-like protein
LIICDIDHFKRINDTYGHQAGDDALVTFAGVLREISREGDLVARYGGEEFVVLCAGCDNPAATSRAEEIRRAVERTPVPSLDGNTMTASFGVTEIQLGDTPATLVSRADRALLTAKSSGRNRVVQLGAGQDPRAEVDVPLHAPQEHRSGWLGWFRNEQESPLVQTQRLASVPHALAVQKLQGFISDHCADVLKIEDTHVTLKIDSSKSESGRRRHERPTVMIMDVSIAPVDYRAPRTNTYQSKTMLEIIIRPVRARDRRSDALLGQAQQLLASFNSYLVTQEITEDMRARIIQAR